MVDIAEALADGRQCGRDDGLFQRRKEHGEHDPHAPALPLKLLLFTV